MTDPNETAPEKIEPEGTEPEEIEEETDEPIDEDWERRVLCSDGNCIGVIGPDGRCKECGKPYEGELPVELESPESTAEDAPGPEADDEAGDGPDGEAPQEAASESDDDWENRVLCSDGNCIGVIGPDGRCKECGKPYEGE
jgi:hypothetical protein